MKIITAPADLVTVHRKSVPPHVAAAVAKSLEKLPADRFESAKAFGEALGNPAFTVAGTAGVTAPSSLSRGGRRGSLLAWAVAVIALVAAVAGWMRRTPEAPFRRFDLTMGDVLPLPNSDVVISRDGSLLAMAASAGSVNGIYVRRLDGDAEFRILAGTETGFHPAFSPDGQWIVFKKYSDRSLVKISVGGGGAVTLVPGGKFDLYFPQWGPSNEIIFVTPSAVSYRIAASGGEVTPIPKLRTPNTFPLPDGSGVLHDLGGQVALYDFKSDSSVVLIPGGSRAVYLASGHIVYVASEGGLFAVAFDLAKRRVGGAPVRVLERVRGLSHTKRSQADIGRLSNRRRPYQRP